MAFHVGQKVVCVDDAIGDHTHLKELILGEIYTIRGNDPESITNGVLLEEIRLPIIKPWKLEMSFRASRFRPIVEKKYTTEAGMTILREILERETIKPPVKASEHQK